VCGRAASGRHGDQADCGHDGRQDENDALHL
jgi:hypothetical protein